MMEEKIEQFYADVEEILLSIAAAGVPLSKVSSPGPQIKHVWNDGGYPKLVFKFKFEFLPFGG